MFGPDVLAQKNPHDERVPEAFIALYAASCVLCSNYLESIYNSIYLFVYLFGVVSLRQLCVVRWQIRRTRKEGGRGNRRKDSQFSDLCYIKAFSIVTGENR